MLMPDDMKIYFYTQPVDMRKSIDTLNMLISEVLKTNPVDGSLFLFRGKSGNKLKALYYEMNCFTLWYRRLEKGKFVFMRDSTGCIEMSHEHLKWAPSSEKNILQPDLFDEAGVELPQEVREQLTDEIEVKSHLRKQHPRAPRTSVLVGKQPPSKPMAKHSPASNSIREKNTL